MIRFIFGLFTLLVLAAGALLLLLENPDRFKPQITAAAEAGTGYSMEIRGELSWRYWPPIAINVQDISLSTPGNEPFASFSEMSIDVDLLPLLTQQTAIDINEVLLAGGRVSLAVDEDGNQNWVASDTPAPAKAEGGDEDTPALGTSIDRLRVDGLHLSYRNLQDGSDLEFSIERLVTSALATDKPFDVSLAMQATDHSQELTADISVTGQLLYKGDTGNINFSDFVTTIDAKLAGEGYPRLSMTSSGEWRNGDQQVILNKNTITVSALNMSTIGVVSVAGSEPRFDGAVELDIADPAKLESDLDIALPVSFLEVRTDITATPSQLQFLTLEGGFDDSKFTGTGSLQTGDDFYLKSELRLDRLDTARYLASEDSTAKGGSQVAGDAELLPYEALRSRKMDVILRIGELLYEGDTFNATRVEIKCINWRFVVNANTQAYDGKVLFNSNSVLKEGGETRIRFSLDDMNVQDLIDYTGVTGRISGNSNLTFTGNMMSDVTNTLEGKTAFRVLDGTLDVRPIKNLAGTIDSLRGKPSAVSQWPDIMPFRQMMGQHVFSGGTRDGQILNADLENLNIMAVGGFDLTANTLAYDVSAMFQEPAEGQFKVGSDLVGIRWPMTCEGRFDDPPADLCFGKDGAISELVADLVKQEIKRKGNEKLKEVIGDKVPEEYRELTDELFKNLFNQ